MKYILILIISLSLFTSCKKWKYGYPDTQFRNTFVGTYHVDSIVKHLFNVQDSLVMDTNFTVHSLKGDFIEILPTKDQVEKNVTCTGRFLDSVFRYEVQGFNDKGAERLGFTPCNSCAYSEIFGLHFVGSKYIVTHTHDKLILENRFKVNGRDFFSRVYLTKH